MTTPKTIEGLQEALPGWKIEVVGNGLYINPDGEENEMMEFPYWHKARHYKSIAAAYAAALAFDGEKS